MLSVCLILFAFVATGLSSVTPPSSCTYNGKMYKVGESFQPSPCEHCFCSPDGRTPCAIADCFVTPCVDAIHDPTKCCPVCPTGENCRHADGTIIKKGDVYTPANSTEVCQCDSSFHFGGPRTMCAISMQNQHEPLVVS